MRYMGGKAKIAKALGEYLRARLEGRYFVEPFCGALNVTAQMTGARLANDMNPYLFTLYSSLQAGWVPPDYLSEEEYASLKNTKDSSNPLTAFAGFGCSFAGRWFGAYARDSKRSNYCLSAKNSLLKKFDRCSDVTFSCVSYKQLSPTDQCLVYCDPPYADTTGYDAVGGFDNTAFWQWVRELASKGVTVLVSEYKAPADFTSVWSTQHTVTAGSARQGGTKLTEHLFEYCP